MRAFLLFDSPRKVQKPRIPGRRQRVVRVMAHVVPDGVEPVRFKPGELEHGLLVYCPMFEGICLGMGLDDDNQACKCWHVVVPPFDLSHSEPSRLKVFGPIKDSTLLEALPREVKHYFASL